jgi:hypothetical protein
MGKPWIIGAQLSTSHSAAGTLALDDMLIAVNRLKTLMDLGILVLGAREVPDIFRGLTGSARAAGKVYLWYNVLSDVPGTEDADLVVNWRGERSRGWGGWSEKGEAVDESFRFACPNNPRVRRRTLDRLRELLVRYPFDGVFLDKIRFPSPANGVEEVISCFCGHCRAAARHVGLDLQAVSDAIERALKTGSERASPKTSGVAVDWLGLLLADSPLLAQFVRFRAQSITGLVADARRLTTGLGRELALDLFSPGLGPLVGQDYAALARECDWVKPMTYRVALGPAGLRLEIPQLVEGASRILGVSEDAVIAWAARHLRDFAPDTLAVTRERAVPLELMAAEISAAVRLSKPKPVYFGLELVRHPGVIDITPALVEEMVAAGQDGDAAGTIISWDLMHAPQDGLRTLAALL